MVRNPAVSVIVPVYNDRARLSQCLKALSRQSLGVENFEVIVVDNGSVDDPEDIVASHDFATILKEPVPGSYNARNAGVGAAGGALLAFTDADCLPDQGWLTNAVQYFASSPHVSAIGGRIQVSLSESPTSSELYESVYAFRQERYVGQYRFAATANLVVRRDEFFEAGLFDGARKSGGDLEWGQRFAGAGHVMAYAPGVVVHHPARRGLLSLIQKRRRTAGGRHAAPRIGLEVPWDDPQPRGLRMLWCLLFNQERIGLKGRQGWQVLGVTCLLWCVDRVERIRLVAGGRPLR